MLDAPDLDHAVARGAAYYGLARRGRGIRIRSGAARSYYVGIESAMPAVPGLPAPLKALCVVPFGMEEGTSATIGDASSAWSSASRRVPLPQLDRAQERPARHADRGLGRRPRGARAARGDAAARRAREDDVVPVTLESRVTEVGTLELWCVARDGQHRWKLELNIRERGRLTPRHSGRLLVGIDLGTTNSAVASDAPWTAGARVQRCSTFRSWSSAGEVGARRALPSFLYFLEPEEQATGGCACRGTTAPTLSPASSRATTARWCRRGRSRRRSRGSRIRVDRRRAAPAVGREAGAAISPVEASARLLAHIRDAWNHAHAGDDERAARSSRSS